jgi:uncharacterized protein (DUF302 family)
MRRFKTIGVIGFGVMLALGPAPGLSFGQQPATPATEQSGLLTLQSRHSAAETLSRFEAAVKAAGWIVFTRIDHAAAADAVGLKLRARTVVLFGNPNIGTGTMQSNPTVAIDLPLKALVWEDDSGAVQLTLNSAEYVGGDIYPRHGLSMGPEGRQGLAGLLTRLAEAATR